MAKKTISTLNIPITADARGVKKGVDKAKVNLKSLTASAKGAFKGLAGSVAIFTAALVAGLAVARKLLTQLIKSAAQFDELVKSARTLRVEVDKLQAVQLLAEFSGGDAANMVFALERMTISIGDAAKGSGEAADAFAALGLNVEALKSTDAVTAMEQMARALQKVGTRAEQLDILASIVGSRRAGNLINTLDAMAGGLDDVDRLVRDLGLSLDAIDASNIEEMNDAIVTAKKSVEGLTLQLTAELAPAIKDASLAAANFAAELQKWVPIIAQVTLFLVEFTKQMSTLFFLFDKAANLLGLVGDEIANSFDEARKPVNALAVDVEFLADAISGVGNLDRLRAELEKLKTEAKEALQGPIGAVDIRTQSGLSAVSASDRERTRAEAELRRDRVEKARRDARRDQILAEIFRAIVTGSADRLTVVETTISG